jgi:DNA-binding NarL/FixJ family response regulator
MPVLNGIRAAKRVLELNLSIKVVFLTAYNDPEICRAAMETGASCYVLKPRMASDPNSGDRVRKRRSSIRLPGLRMIFRFLYFSALPNNLGS